MTRRPGRRMIGVYRAALKRSEFAVEPCSAEGARSHRNAVIRRGVLADCGRNADGPDGAGGARPGKGAIVTRGTLW